MTLAQKARQNRILALAAGAQSALRDARPVLQGAPVFQSCRKADNLDHAPRIRPERLAG